MLVAHKCCPKCGTRVDEDSIFSELNLCHHCSTSLLVDIGEEELKGSEHKYRLIDTSQMREPTEEEKAYMAEMEQHIGDMGNKPFHLFKMKTPSPASMKGSYKGLIWLIFFGLLTIGMIIFMFTVFDWYTLIPVVAVTLITLYKQKRP